MGDDLDCCSFTWLLCFMTSVMLAIVTLFIAILTSIAWDKNTETYYDCYIDTTEVILMEETDNIPQTFSCSGQYTIMCGTIIVLDDKPENITAWYPECGEKSDMHILAEGLNDQEDKCYLYQERWEIAIGSSPFYVDFWYIAFVWFFCCACGLIRCLAK